MEQVQAYIHYSNQSGFLAELAQVRLFCMKQ